jgi:hypothetical protein
VVAFLVERRPPAPHVVLVAVMVVAASSLGVVLLADGSVDTYPLPAPGVALALLAATFVLRLRVYDDVKDADTDATENPTRPIPRGAVSVRELDAAAWWLLALECVCAAAIGPVTLAWWGVAAVWSVLMRVEFFVPRWLSAHVGTYAISHMVVLGLVFGMFMVAGVEARGAEIAVDTLIMSPIAVLAMTLATFLGCGFEWGHKFERYHAAHGERAWTTWMLWPSAGAIGWVLVAREQLDPWTTLVLAVVALGTIFGHALFAGQRPRSGTLGVAGAAPTGGLRTAVELGPGITGLLVYCTLAIGATWAVFA